MTFLGINKKLELHLRDMQIYHVWEWLAQYGNKLFYLLHITTHEHYRTYHHNLEILKQ